MECNKTIIEIVPTANWGGGEQYVYNISAELTENMGSRVFILARKGGKDDFRKRFSELDISGFGYVKNRSMFDILSIFRLGKYISCKKADIVHVHIFKDAFIAVFAKKLFRKNCRIVMTRHLARKGKKSFMYGWLYKNLDKLLFVSEFTKDRFFSTGIDKNSFVWAVNPHALRKTVLERIDMNRIDIRKEYGISRTSTVFGFAGRIAEEKAVDVIIGAAAELKGMDIHILIIGKASDQSYMDRLLTMTQDCGISEMITFTGFKKDPISLIAGCDAGLLPSRVEEASPLSALEFMSCGIPMIVTGTGGQKEAVTDGVNGLCVPVNDTKALASAIRRLSENSTLRKEMGKSARSYALGHDMTDHIEKIVTF